MGELRARQERALDSTTRAIRQAIDVLGEDARHYVLVTPYGGLTDLDDWYSREFQKALLRVQHIETSALEEEAILFDRRQALASYRFPEEKVGLTPVDGTSIALGVFEDVSDAPEPQVRIETGEIFVVWGGEVPSIRRFALQPNDGVGDLDLTGELE